MFKISSAEQEIYDSMEKLLVSNSVEETHNFSKVSKAIDYLDAAAAIFEESGLSAEAEDIIQILNKLSKA